MQKLYNLLNLLRRPYISWLKNALVLLVLINLPKVGFSQCKAVFTYSVNQGKVTCVSNSTTTSGFPLIYAWNFGTHFDYYYSLSDTIQYQYQKSDTYTVSLMIIDSAGNCTDSFSQSVYVFVADTICDAQFTVTSATDYPRAIFEISNYSPSSSIEYYWNLGDGSALAKTSAGKVQYDYEQSGTYNVCLITINSKTNCTDTFCSKVTVKDVVNKIPCKAGFSYNNSFTHVMFSSQSYCYGANSGYSGVTKYLWDFGDGTTSSESDPWHIYPHAGSYNVTLIVSGRADYAPDTIQKTVFANGGGCSADFELYNNPEGVIVKFTRMNSTKFEIDFGDGTIINKPDTSFSDSLFSHLYAKAGTYTICLKKTDTFYNCVDTVCKTVTVSDPEYCYAGFNPFIYQESRSVSFTYDKYFAGLQTSHHAWDFGDGNSDTGKGKSFVYHTYASDGTYDVRLIVLNQSHSCADTVIKTIIIKKPVYKAPIVVYSDVVYDSLIVYLIGYNSADSTLYTIDTGYLGTEADTGSSYCIFDSLNPGKYYVKVAAARTSDWYNNYMPTYIDSALFWVAADAIILDGNSPGGKFAMVKLLEGNNPGGAGFIGGKISQGANKKEGDPMPDIQVMLLDADRKPVTHTYSDANGNFKFANIGFGSYEVYTEVTGIKTNSAVATISTENPKIENVEVKISSKGISTSIKSWFVDLFSIQPKLYPNPTQNVLYLETNLLRSQNSKLVICNILGQEVYSENINLQQGSQMQMIDTEKLPAGAYILMLKNASGVNVMQAKFMKY